MVANILHYEGITKVLTFDSHGISGHPNHRAVHSGVRAFLLEEGKLTEGRRGSVQGWELEVCAVPLHGSTAWSPLLYVSFITGIAVRWLFGLPHLLAESQREIG